MFECATTMVGGGASALKVFNSVSLINYGHSPNTYANMVTNEL